MPLDAQALRHGCRQGGELRLAEQLCRAQLGRFLAGLGEARPVTVACTQEAPLFTQEAEAAGHTGDLIFVNLREQAGWSTEAAAAGPKMAALLAAAAVPMPPTPVTGLESRGVTLLLGRDETALAAAEQLKDRLDLTVLLTGEAEVTPLRSAEYPVLRGRAHTATGWLGAFELVVDGYAAAAPSSRAAYRWGSARDGAVSRCDLILDLTGRTPLFPTHDLREGYLRADPADALAVQRAVARAGELVGSFDKPRFVTYEAGLCAHARNRRTGCTRCLELCPTGAITPGRDAVQVSAEICAGCGACAAVCPTGAATYALPPPDALLRRLRSLLLTYREAGGASPVLLLHDEAHGTPLLDALARHGDGLPARVLPLRVNEVTALDLGLLMAAFAWGAAALRVLLPGRRRPHGAEGLFRNLDYVGAVLRGFGLEAESVARAAAIELDDPFLLPGPLHTAQQLETGWTPDGFLALGQPRELLHQALRALHRAASASPRPGAALPMVVPLPERAPLGEARVRVEGCTLCLACTSVCPTGAFTANPERPQLRFLEDACVQCGLCAATCPERVIELVPRLNLTAEASAPRIIKDEEPFRCLRCDKAFGTKSSIDRVVAKLTAGRHWMFRDPERLRALMLCEDCRVIEMTAAGMDPYAGPERPRVVTTDDYRRAGDDEGG